MSARRNIPHWNVRPAKGSRWTIENPNGSVTDCPLGSIAIELGTKLARENNGCVLFYTSDGSLRRTRFQRHARMDYGGALKMQSDKAARHRLPVLGKVAIPSLTSRQCHPEQLAIRKTKG
jgi:hypothetical protein